MISSLRNWAVLNSVGLAVQPGQVCSYLWQEGGEGRVFLHRNLSCEGEKHTHSDLCSQQARAAVH